VVASVVDSHWSGLASLLDLLADTLDRLRSTLPGWIAGKLPTSIEQLQHVVAVWLRSNAQHVQTWGHEIARGAAHVFVGAVVGILAALEEPIASESQWLEIARLRGRNFVRAFSDILLAQLTISAVNTALTAAFVLVVLPVMGVRLPYAGVLVGLTFLTGLVPIVGNLLSNTAILLVALTISPAAAFAALAFLLVIHKLEYVLNAHFAGRRTAVPASALLASMLVLEALFGIAGLVVAPIYCAWAFKEMRSAGIL
jgi:predicted PurR-regulated permease PerM